MLRLLCTVILLVVASARISITTATITASPSGYSGYKVYDIVPRNVAEIKLLHSFEYAGVDFWMSARTPRSVARVMIAPDLVRTFEKFMLMNRFDFRLYSENVDRMIQLEDERLRFAAARKSGSMFETYQRFDEINDYLETLSKKYSSLTRVETIGTSYEGRSLKVLHISNGAKADGSSKPSIFVDAGIHAREWMAPATALFIINQLVEKFDENRDLIDQFDWVVLPVVNPDGYEYSHHAAHRLWRKTRKPNGLCFGTDGNRNFDFHWGEVGASNMPCSDTYRGTTALSEPETLAVASVLKALNGTCQFYLTLHTYGNYLLYPWGYTSALPDTWKDLEAVSQAGRKAIQEATGTRYTVGSSTNVLYAAAGGSDDYAFAVHKVPISITMELTGGGSAGFNPPPNAIAKSVAESWIGIRAMAAEVARKYNHSA